MVTPEEMDRLNELGKRYADSGDSQDSLTAEEWKFVYAMADKLIAEHNASRKSLPDEN